MGGAVAAGHPLTARAGADVLAAGGNAVDACIAAAAVGWVVESPLTGPGAGGFMLVHRARDGRDAVLDFFVSHPGRGLPPGAGGKPEAVAVPFGAGDTTQTFLVGPASCAVPGAVAGLAAAHRLFGTVPWPELLAPAIALARGGVDLTREQALLHAVLDGVLRREPEGREVYGARAPLRAGERLVMAALAGTLERVAAEGEAAFYRGELAGKLAAAVAGRGGRITVDDLAAYRVVRRRPVRVAYRGHEVASNGPPSAGGVLIAYALRVLDAVGPGGPPGSPDALATLAEAAREAAIARGGTFAAALHRGGLAGRLLGDEGVRAAVGRVRAGGGPAAPLERRLPSTTHVSVLDGRGNAASLSSSTGCGSGVFVPGTGIQLNNMLGEIDLNPPDAPARPGLRLTSMMAPTLVLHRRRPRLVVGSAGSERLRGAIVQTIVNVVDHGLPIAEAIERPRVHLDGEELHCEGGIGTGAVEELERRGYRTVRWPGPGRNLYFGGVSAVAVAREGGLEAAGDPRRGGHGVVVE
ncbi:MAG: gamma-glutamyltransferase [Thermoleophilia bacterium]|nr:gamma-glutamyltransferase [Thermoleophilia bacterium]